MRAAALVVLIITIAICLTKWSYEGDGVLLKQRESDIFDRTCIYISPFHITRVSTDKMLDCPTFRDGL